MERSEGGEVVTNLGYGGEYRDKLKEAQATGKCPFCTQVKEDPSIILFHTICWYVKQNPFPPKSSYPLRDPIEIPAAQAFLIIPFAHLTEIGQLRTDDWNEASALFQRLIGEFRLPGGVLGLRWGTPLHSGRTVLHLHFHVIVPPPHPADAGRVVPVPFWAG